MIGGKETRFFVVVGNGLHITPIDQLSDKLVLSRKTAFLLLS